MMVTDEQRQSWLRAVEAAKAALKPGDRIVFTSCPGTKRWAKFTGWDGNWACSATRNDISARSIVSVNGAPVSFGNEARA